MNEGTGEVLVCYSSLPGEDYIELWNDLYEALAPLITDAAAEGNEDGDLTNDTRCATTDVLMEIVRRWAPRVIDLAESQRRAACAVHALVTASQHTPPHEEKER